MEGKDEFISEKSPGVFLQVHSLPVYLNSSGKWKLGVRTVRFCASILLTPMSNPTRLFMFRVKLCVYNCSAESDTLVLMQVTLLYVYLFVLVCDSVCAHACTCLYNGSFRSDAAVDGMP